MFGIIVEDYMKVHLAGCTLGIGLPTRCAIMCGKIFYLFPVWVHGLYLKLENF